MTNLTITNTLLQQTPNNRSIFASDSSLGNAALISSKSFPRAAKQLKNENKFALLDYARLILSNHDVRSKKTGNEHRTRTCLLRRIDKTQDIGITLNNNPEKSRAGLSNVQTCRSICSCPVCAERIMLEHAETVKKSLIWAENEGYLPVLVSLTASHHAGMNLQDFKEQFKAAWQMFSSHRTWRDYKEKFQIEHWIAAREATREAIENNGWHYHMHQLLFIKKEATRENSLPDDMQAKFTDFWLKCLNKKGLTGSIEHACDVRAGDTVGAEYLTKIGVSETLEGKLEYELTGGENKGKTIWSVLQDAMFGDIRSNYLYIEYVNALQGENWITTSHGLQDLIKDIELPAAEVDESETLVLWMHIAPEMWTVVVKNRAVHMILLYAALYRDEQKILDYIEALRE